jgi:hypothetical protein
VRRLAGDLRCSDSEDAQHKSNGPARHGPPTAGSVAVIGCYRNLPRRCLGSEVKPIAELCGFVVRSPSLRRNRPGVSPAIPPERDSRTYVVSANEWCSWAITQRPASLRSPVLSRGDLQRGEAPEDCQARNGGQQSR